MNEHKLMNLHLSGNYGQSQKTEVNGGGFMMKRWKNVYEAFNDAYELNDD